VERAIGNKRSNKSWRIAGVNDFCFATRRHGCALHVRWAKRGAPPTWEPTENVVRDAGPNGAAGIINDLMLRTALELPHSGATLFGSPSPSWIKRARTTTCQRPGRGLGLMSTSVSFHDALVKEEPK
jgi:hypothetical protein